MDCIVVYSCVDSMLECLDRSPETHGYSSMEKIEFIRDLANRGEVIT